MKKSFTKLIREELVKRFESVVQAEIREHKNEVDITRGVCRALADSYASVKDEIKEMRREMRESLQEKKEEMQKEMREIEASFDQQRRLIRKNIKDVEFFLEETNHKINALVDSKVFNQYRNEVTTLIGAVYKRIEDEKERSDTCAYKNISKVRGDLRRLEMKFIKSDEDQVKNLEALQKKLDTYVIDEQGFEKEMKVLKKSVFILEKKAESLYTLFEGIKKKVES